MTNSVTLMHTITTTELTGKYRLCKKTNGEIVLQAEYCETNYDENKRRFYWKDIPTVEE